MQTKIWKKTSKGNIMVKAQLSLGDNILPLNILFSKVKTKDDRVIFMIKLCRLEYSPKKKRFTFDYSSEGTWLTSYDFTTLIKALKEMVSDA